MPYDPTPEDEMALLEEFQFSVQWNGALYDESCLQIVAGSHRRPRTAEEREVMLNDPMGDMPDQMPVHLAAGQAVYYNPQLFHRGNSRAVCGARRCMHV